MKYKEHPVILPDADVRAAWCGCMTCLCLPIKPQPVDAAPCDPDEGNPELERYRGVWFWYANEDWCDTKYSIRCPFGTEGDRLWVRETWAFVEDAQFGGQDHYEYRADLPVGSTDYPGQWPAEDARCNPDAPKWRSSAVMPRWASRITLEVARVRAIQARDLQEDDVMSLGIPPWWQRDTRERTFYEGWEDDEARNAFADWWDARWAKKGYPFDMDLWLWLVDVKRIEGA